MCTNTKYTNPAEKVLLEGNGERGSWEERLIRHSKNFLQKPKLSKVLEEYTNSPLNQDGLGRERAWN